MNNTNSNLGLGPTVGEFIKDHWGTIISAGYLYLTATGMIFLSATYRRYGINIFEFAELNDFLLAAFREPIAFAAPGVVLIYSLPVYWYLNKRDTFLYRAIHDSSLYPAIRRWFPVTVIVLALASPMLVGFFYSAKGGFERMLWERKVEFSLRRGSTVSNTNIDGEVEYYLIGASEKFLFLLNSSTESPAARHGERSEGA